MSEKTKELVVQGTKTELEMAISETTIKNLMYVIRGQQVMLDSDLAMLYHVETFNLNKAMKRNVDRFPEDFCFQLTKEEYKNLIFQSGISSLQESENKHGGRRKLPYVFTEQGRQEGEEKSIAYGKYDWGVWLKQKCKPNEQVEKLIAEIKEEYSYFEPRNRPELDIEFEPAIWIGDESPKTQDEIFYMEITELIGLLKNYKGSEWRGPSRNGLLINFSNCLKRDFSWSEKVLLALLEEFHGNADVWDYFFSGLDKSS